MSWVNNQNYFENLLSLLKKRETAGLDHPCYVYNHQELEKRIQVAKKHLGSVGIFYAMKANNFPPLLRLMEKLGLSIDTVSTGEIRRALSCGFTPDRIIFSGVGKSKKDLEFAIALNIKQINVESLPELERIETISKNLNTKAKVALRVNPDVEVETHPYIATGFRENKFGIDLKTLGKCQELLSSSAFLDFQGFTIHIGSQIKDLNNFDEAFQKTAAMILQWQKKGFQFKTIDVGGGVGIHYEESSGNEFTEASEENLLKEWSSLIQKHFSLFKAEILSEPGRWLVAHAGILVARVEYIKETEYKNFLILNTGMHHLMRPALYQARHRIVQLKSLINSNPQNTKTYDVVGPICESSDVILTQVQFSDVKEGDWVAILDAGAYGAVMASDYNLHSLPEEMFL